MQHTPEPVELHIHINIHLHHLLCAHSSYFYYIKWLNKQFTDIKNLLFTMSFLFKSYSLVKVIYLFIRCDKTRFVFWNTNNTDRNGVNKQITRTHTNTHHTHRHTHTHSRTQLPNTERKITVESVSWYETKWYPRPRF